jgi:predicted phosphodiesterase
MRIIVVSDTHAQHEELGILTADVLIHCGDGCYGFRRDPAEVDRLDDWFSRQRVGLVLAIGGNHDFEMERRSRASLPVFSHAVYLEDHAHEYRGCTFLHVFGHNHASAGAVRIGPTLHVNASMVNSRYLISHKPIEIDLEVGTRSPATLIRATA